MVCAKSFFDLQLHFADTVAAIAAIPQARALFEYTNLYIRFGCGRDFQFAHPVWQAYLAGLHDAGDAREWTYRFYRACDQTLTGPPIAAAVGCFSYAQLPGDRIRLHFHNTGTGSHSSLGAACVGQRRADLTALFAHVQRTMPASTRVVGISWLYNIEAYRRLFPDSYIATARVMPDRFRGMPLWGQFLDRHGELKEHMVRTFLARLEGQSSLERLHECFPFQALTVEASVQEFYAFYGLEPAEHHAS